ncbi:MAG: hypothetical protein QXR26_03195 [Candidatus Caldarchaeum sp.]
MGESTSASFGWTWTICKQCGMKTITGKFCMRCGAVLDQTQKAEPIQYVYTFDVIVLGEDGVGKTSLINRWAKTPQPNLSQATVEAVKKAVFEGIEVSLRMREMEQNIAKVAGKIDAAVVVFELTRRTTFVRTMRYVRFLRETEPMPLVYLVGNKCDLDGRQVSFDEAARTARDLGAQYFETSAKSGYNVDLVLKRLFKDLLTRRLNELKRMLQQ